MAGTRSQGRRGLASCVLALTTLTGGCSCGAMTHLPAADGGPDARTEAATVADTGVPGMCDPSRVRPPGDPPTGGECTSDADCADGGVNGRCTIVADLGNACTYDECFSDADCPSGQRCACGAGRQDQNRCLLDHCTTCAVVDCAVSWGCEGPTGGGVYGAQAFECHTAADTCRADADCPSDQFCTRGPALPSDSPDPSWHCASRTCS